MGALLALILPLVPSIIQGVEMIFKAKPQSGTDKMSAAMQAVRGVVDQVVASKVPLPDGSAPANPTDDALKGMLETVLAQLQNTGALTAQPVTGSLYLVQGAVTPLKSN